MDDVPEIVASMLYANSDSPNPWVTLSGDLKKRKMSQAKKRLNSGVILQMSWEQIQEADPNGDIVRWLEGIRDRID